MWDLKPEHCRAARHLLRWSASDLAGNAGVAVATVTRLEEGKGELKVTTLRKLVDALERAGIVWSQTDGQENFVQLDDGVRIALRNET